MIGVFPFIENLAVRQLKDWQPDTPLILEVILQIFFKSNKLIIEDYYDEISLAVWMSIVKFILDRDLDVSMTTTPD